MNLKKTLAAMMLVLFPLGALAQDESKDTFFKDAMAGKMSPTQAEPAARFTYEKELKDGKLTLKEASEYYGSSE